MNKVTFQTSQKKQYIIAGVHAAAMLAFVSFPLYLGFPPPLSLTIQLVLVIGIALIGWSCLRELKRVKDAKCPSCGAELFNAIEAAKIQNTAVNYCVSCGESIEI